MLPQHLGRRVRRVAYVEFSTPPSLHAFSTTDGHQLWSVAVANDQGQPSIANNIAYIDAGGGAGLAAVDLAAHTVLGSTPSTPNPDYTLAGGQPAIANGTVYLAGRTGTGTGQIEALVPQS